MEWIIMQNYENLKDSHFDDKNFKNKVIYFFNVLD